MEPTISDAGPFEKLMTFEIADDALDRAKAQAARKLAKSMKIPGFRPGKAPRRVVEAAVGEDRLRAEAIEEALPGMVGSALEAANLEPAATPSVESLNDTETGVEVAVRVALWPTLAEPPEYVGREIEVPSVEVGDDELEAQFDRIRDQFSEIEPSEAPAGEGDFVSIDLSATRHGEPVDSLSAQGLMIEIGGNEFIPGMSDAVVGKAAGETATFAGPLPAGFVETTSADEEAPATAVVAEDVSIDEDEVVDAIPVEPGDEGGEDDGGEDVVEYSVALTQVHSRKRPEIDDAWVDENTEFETLAEFSAELRRRLADAKLGSSYNTFRSELITALTDEIDIEIPDSIINGEMEEVLHRFSHSLSDQGIEMSDYLRVSGQSEAAFVEDLRASAVRNVRTDLLLDAVSEDAGLEVDDDEFDDLLRALAAQSEQTLDELRDSLSENQVKKLRSDILRRKAHDALMKAAVPVDEAGTPIDFETLASQLATPQDEAEPDGSSEVEAEKEDHE